MNEVGIIITFVVCVLLVLLGVIASLPSGVRSRPAAHGSAYFTIMCVALSGWLASNILSDIDTSSSLLWIRLSFVSVSIAAYCFFMFVTYYPRPRHHLMVSLCIATTATILMVLLTLTPVLIPSVIIIDGIATVVPGTLYPVFIVFLLSILTAAFYRLSSNKALHRSERSQLNSIRIGVFIMAVTSLVTNLLLPLITGNNSLYWLAAPAVLVFTGATAFSIAKHRLFNVRLAVVRSTAYILSLATIGSVYLLAAYTISRVLIISQLPDVSRDVFNLFLAFAIAFTFQPILKFYNDKTAHVFYRDGYTYDEFVTKVGRSLASTTDLVLLLNNVSAVIADLLKSENITFCVYQNNGKALSAGTHGSVKISTQDARTLDHYFSTNKVTSLITDTMKSDVSVRRLLAGYRIALIIPLRLEDTIIGYIGLSDQKGSIFSHYDVTALLSVVDELSIAIHNSLSVMEVKELNETLQQRIDAATKELRDSNEQLRNLDVAKDEFVSMASHQLRTPLTSVKGYISMVLEGDAGKITAMQRKLLTESFASSERMVHLINDFLNVSRVQTGKFMIELADLDLCQIVRQEVESLRRSAEARELSLVVKVPNHKVVTAVDDGKIRQVIMNFIDNAIYYSRPNTEIIVSLSQTSREIRIEVQDHGIGVPVKQQAQLFSKFFRADNARTQRPDGTGVGLYLAKMIVDGHKGKIIFSSKEGEGSTFGFSIPLTAKKD